MKIQGKLPVIWMLFLFLSVSRFTLRRPGPTTDSFCFCREGRGCDVSSLCLKRDGQVTNCVWSRDAQI